MADEAFDDAYDEPGTDIAVIGMAGRFPGADDVPSFWRNLREGVESIRQLTDEELRERGVPESTIADPAYVKAAARLEGVDRFDAAFFGYSPREAQDMDPQHRLFLETCWEALESAGYDGGNWPRPIGVYGGTGVNTYLLLNLIGSERFSDLRDISSLQGLMNGNNKDSMTTTVSYKLNLRGPGVTVQTACSTSLASVHVASRALLNHEADMALAGGSWVNLLHNDGYRHQVGAILSTDGHCRAFDAQASGTVIGSGVGIVVLKRLEDALADGDTISAVIKGSAMNNDGSAKVGYTAPSVEGQAEVILAAQAMAGVNPDTIGYIEAHGTGTTMGDPIEIAALSQAFRATTDRTGYCGIGSVKSNVGHLDAAAGVTGLIKAVLALKHGELPPSLHFETPNPRIDFEGSPFYVNAALKDWPDGDVPRRAGVSSFGIGGTNVHVVLEQAPDQTGDGASRGWQLLPLSARTPTALDQMAQRLADHLRAHPELRLADVAHTLQVGRKRFAHRTAVACRTAEEAIAALEGRDARRRLAQDSGPAPEATRVAFMFPGQGAQHVDMGRELYEREPVFRDTVDQCAQALRPLLDLDLRELLYPAPGGEQDAATRLGQTALTQPALFVVEYALARLWQSWGLVPAAMIGHSIGEYVAACLAGVFSLHDALSLVATRGRLLQSMAPGAMVAVPLPEAQVRPLLGAGCDLAAVNAEALCVLAGSHEAIESATRALQAQGATVHRLHVSHAFHSAMVEPMLPAFEQALRGVRLNAPTTPFVSNVTGRWITAEEATDPSYWLRHLRGTVRFADGVAQLLADPSLVLLEVGPGQTLSTLAQRHAQAQGAQGKPARAVVPSAPRIASQGGVQEGGEDTLARAVGRLWLAGIEIDWSALRDGERRRRVPLPTYPFEKQRFWVEPGAQAGALLKGRAGGGALTLADVVRGPDGWFSVPSWTRVAPAPWPVAADANAEGCRVVFADRQGLGDLLAAQWRGDAGRSWPVVIVRENDGVQRAARGEHLLKPDVREDHDRVLRAIADEHGPIAHIAHLWSVGDAVSPALARERAFYSPLYLAQALDADATLTVDGAPLGLTVVTNGLADVTGQESLDPDKATVLGLHKVMAQECPGIVCRVLDVVPPAPDSAEHVRLIEQIAAEAALPAASTALGEGMPAQALVALRGPRRWVESYQPLRLDTVQSERLRADAVVLITGGLGGVGLSVARHLAAHGPARLALLGRNAMPARDQWDALLADSAPAAAGDDALRARQAVIAREVRALEAQGAQVLLLHGDVAIETELRAAWQATQARFGAVHGVVHAAGDPGGGLIAQVLAEQVERTWAAKVEGARTLLALAAEQPRPLDFIVLCSSMATIAGGLGKAAYAAANAWLDVAARRATGQPGTPVWSINWDSWRDVGMAGHMAMPEGVGIAPDEGARALVRIVQGPRVAQVVVSTVDLAARLDPRRNDLLSQPGLADAAPRAAGHARPALDTPFVAPEGELETHLASIWQTLLGIDAIGIDDNLFELGGDSLLGIQLLSRVKAAYAVDLRPADFFKKPTVAELAALVESRLLDEIERTGEATSA
ncbi:MAG TPA: SDR family NAD(P)-dependent oxidoreductase [Candidatus Aquabacterium excrementipullorum]|nr:SDR family NAD(P)-dependent oxidoreductase [Candidatus Aquabacterium excrementipullorum]